MGTVTFRPDYAKFMLQGRPEINALEYRALNELSHQMKFAGEWLKSHKYQTLWYNKEQDVETCVIEIWGEWAGIVEKLDWTWLIRLKRFDVRGIVWDAGKDTIVDMGQHLQRTITSHNVYVYSTKPATKRQGRDRGGVGFAIGSHKSDLRITTYKRTGEPVAQEFQCSGAMISRLTLNVYDWYQKTGQTTDPWKNLTNLVRKEGEKRLMRILEKAGVGTYWPVLGAEDMPKLPPIQAGFVVELGDIIDDDSALLGEAPE